MPLFQGFRHPCAGSAPAKSGARKTGIPVYISVWIKKSLPGYIPAVIVELQLEGCSFDGSRLLENQRDSLSVSTIPPCVVTWVTKDSPSPYNLAECISLPLYYSSDRYKLVTCLDQQGAVGPIWNCSLPQELTYYILYG